MGGKRLPRLPGVALLAAAMLTAATACSSGGKSQEGAATTVPAVTTTKMPTSPVLTTTTLGVPPEAGSIPFIEFAGTSPPDGVSPAGSGCTPPSLTGLPDGSWFGMLKAVAPDAGTIGLDLACIFGGSAANAAAKADGATVLPVPNDHWIRNNSAYVYTLHAVPGVAVGVLGANGSAATRYPTRTGLTAAVPAAGNWVWVLVRSGWVVAIQQQYIP